MAVPPAKQRQNIENLGGVDEVIEIDSCHDVMVREPQQLAAVLDARLDAGIAPRLVLWARVGARPALPIALVALVDGLSMG